MTAPGFSQGVFSLFQSPGLGSTVTSDMLSWGLKDTEYSGIILISLYCIMTKLELNCWIMISPFSSELLYC